MTQLIKGCYRDVLTDSQGRVQWASGWRPNLIVQRCNVLLAALMKGHLNMGGILYWAVGAGEDDWDTTPPSPLVTTSQLTREVDRKALTEEHIVYLDHADKPMDSPSNRLEITAIFKGEDFVSNDTQPLREFGLFGGDATETPDSGLMIDYVIHPRVDLKPETILSRKLRLTFASSGMEEVLFGFGAGLPVTSLDGVGDTYARAFSEWLGIHTLGELVEVDPLEPIGDIPPVKLREFRAKARLVMRLHVSPASLVPFADFSVSHFLQQQPEDLASQDVTPDMVQRLQEGLAVLQIALDDAQLQAVTLGDLMNAWRSSG